MSLNNDNIDDSETYIYLYVCTQFVSVQKEWTAYVVALAAVKLYDLCARVDI